VRERERERERKGERQTERDRHGYFNNLKHLLLDAGNSV